MFKKRALQITMVEPTTPVGPVISIDPETIQKLAKDYTLYAAGVVGVIFAANKILDTTCKIAVITAKAKIK